ncbi:hypothetical protein [Bacillus aerolatus]|uniref:hypothetical protein n=1 Tax=Bacillus aerolatus TaxID=2653354 RepID=UPI00177D141A|nr:hypothetical protein [Bacillus aerolatus]
MIPYKHEPFNDFSSETGCFVQPAIIADFDPKARLIQGETFSLDYLQLHMQAKTTSETF